MQALPLLSARFPLPLLLHFQRSQTASLKRDSHVPSTKKPFFRREENQSNTRCPNADLPPPSSRSGERWTLTSSTCTVSKSSNKAGPTTLSIISSVSSMLLTSTSENLSEHWTRR